MRVLVNTNGAVKENKVREGNALLAQFMFDVHNPGKVQDPYWYLIDLKIEYALESDIVNKQLKSMLCFDEHYSWIMPVIDTINTIDNGVHSILICKNIVKLIINESLVTLKTGNDSKFEACVSFANWYYKNKKE